MKGNATDSLLACGKMEGDVDDGFEIHGFAVVFGGAEFPLGEGAHGVGVELRVNSFHQLDGVHRTVAANDRVEDYFAFDVFRNRVGRILGIHFA